MGYNVSQVVGVMKAYSTCVGEGGFVAEKEKMLKQLEFDKREMDGRYTSMRQKQEEEIKQQLLSEAETKITRQREHYEAAKRRLEEDFAQKKDSLAEKIFESIISP